MDLSSQISRPSDRSLRYGLLIPMALLIASIMTGCLSYSKAKQNLTEDLNQAIIALAGENSRLLTQPDTIAAMRQMYEATHKPLIFQASDIDFNNPILKAKACYSLALVDAENVAPKALCSEITSDSIILVPEQAADGFAIELQGFADCSMASVFAVSDQTLPGLLFALALLSMTSIFIWLRRDTAQPEADCPTLVGIRLTPMQRRLAQMLLEAPEHKVDKSTLCSALWGNKSNAEESLYTLVKRTKAALADSDFEIICNRGDSYGLRLRS